MVDEKYRVLTHHFTLLNSTPTLAEFTLSTKSEKFRVSDIYLRKKSSNDNDCISLQPEHSVSVSGLKAMLSVFFTAMFSAV